MTSTDPQFPDRENNPPTVPEQPDTGQQPDQDSDPYESDTARPGDQNDVEL